MTSLDAVVALAPGQPELSITVDANAAAIAWQNAALAMSDDKHRRILFKNISLEIFEGHGVQLIATDGTILFRTWIPSHHEAKPWPADRRKPTRAVIVMDRDGFALGFMKILQRAAKPGTYEPLVITVEPKDEGGQQALSEDLAAYVLRLSALGQVQTLPLMQEVYPDWRSLKLGIEQDERVETLTISTRMFQTLGKIKQASKIDVQLLGEQKQLAVTAWALEVMQVQGIVMPMRRVDADEKANRAASIDESEE